MRMLNRLFFFTTCVLIFGRVTAQNSEKIRVDADEFLTSTVTMQTNFSVRNEVFEVIDNSPLKVRKQRFGTILGVQRGEITNFVIGAEMQFKRKRLLHPSEWATNLGLEYNIRNNILGYRLGFYHKKGRIALTYGGSLCYLTDFEGGGSFGITPNIGFKLLGFHLTTGYNLLLDSKNLKNYNTFYIGLAYYFPISSDTDVIKNKKKKKKDIKEPFFDRIFKKKD